MSKLPKDKIKILLLEGIHPVGVEKLKEAGFAHIERLDGALQDVALIQKLKDVDLVGIRSNTHLTSKVLKACAHLTAIGCFCIGVNQVDLEAASHLGIPVFNDPYSNTRSVAEMVIALSIILMRDLFTKSIAAQRGEWRKVTEGAHEVRGKTIGIIGYGHVGTQVSLLAEALGMSVIYYDIEMKLPLGNAKSTVSLEELIKKSDIVTLHVPETKETLKLINKERLALFKKGSYLINTSRGKVIDLDALHESLESGSIRGAAVDVFYDEPKTHSDPFITSLQKLPNVILTPHVGGATEEAQEMIALNVAQKLAYFYERGSSEGAVNFPELALPPNKNTHRILHIHRNIPGVLSEINTLFGSKGINIVGQYLKTIHDIGYVVFDIEKTSYKGLEEDLGKIKGTIRTRVLY